MKIRFIKLSFIIVVGSLALQLSACNKTSQPKTETAAENTPPAVDTSEFVENQIRTTQAQERYFRGAALAIVKRAYFYSSADLNSKRRDYIVSGQSAEVQKEKGDFIYTRFVYAGRETRGWMYKRDFMITEGEVPSFSNNSSNDYRDHNDYSPVVDTTIATYETNINGNYTYKNRDIAARITIMGNKWFGNHIILGESDMEVGVVKGNDLYDESGFVKVGYVSGRNLHTSLLNRQITLKKEQ